MHDMSDQIISFTKDALVKLSGEDWLTVKHFPFVLLNSEIDLKDWKLQDLSEDNIEFFIDLALEDADTFELLQAVVANALDDNDEIPPAVYNFALYAFSEKISKPRRRKSNRRDAKDFSLLMLAEIISYKYGIAVGRNDNAKKKDSAFDYILNALRDLKKDAAFPNNVTTTFNSLSRLRVNKPLISDEVNKLMPYIERQIDKRP